MDQKLIITPKTKVLQLIEAYPHLEDVLIEYVPAFKKLKNPILRNTVAKIATLQQARNGSPTVRFCDGYVGAGSPIIFNTRCQFI